MNSQTMMLNHSKMMKTKKMNHCLQPPFINSKIATRKLKCNTLIQETIREIVSESRKQQAIKAVKTNLETQLYLKTITFIMSQ